MGIDLPDYGPAGPDHQCEYERVVIGRDDATELLPAGSEVLLPCPCGETPYDELEWANQTLDETERAFTRYAMSDGMSLFHWSPTKRRGQIIRHGLLPRRRATTHASPGWRAPYVCFADTPRWAWALSGGQRSAPPGSWDLWETRLCDLVEPRILPNAGVSNGIHEIRTEHRVYKRHLWLAGSRVKDPRP